MVHSINFNVENKDDGFFRFRDARDRTRIVDIASDDYRARGVTITREENWDAAKRNHDLEIVVISLTDNGDPEIASANELSIKDLVRTMGPGDLTVTLPISVGQAAGLSEDVSEFEVLNFTTFSDGSIVLEAITKLIPSRTKLS